MDKVRFSAIKWLMLLSLGLMAQGCHYKIRPVKKVFVGEDTPGTKEAVIRKKVAGKPYIFILSQGRIFALDQVSLSNGMLRGHASRSSKWMYPIAQKTRAESLPAELENHKKFEQMLYLEVEGVVEAGDFLLEWDRLKSITFYK